MAEVAGAPPPRGYGCCRPLYETEGRRYFSSLFSQRGFTDVKREGGTIPRTVPIITRVSKGRVRRFEQSSGISEVLTAPAIPQRRHASSLRLWRQHAAPPFFRHELFLFDTLIRQSSGTEIWDSFLIVDVRFSLSTTVRRTAPLPLPSAPLLSAARPRHRGRMCHACLFEPSSLSRIRYSMMPLPFLRFRLFPPCWKIGRRTR